MVPIPTNVRPVPAREVAGLGGRARQKPFSPKGEHRSCPNTVKLLEIERGEIWM
jgi:hypothetical protein